MNENERGAYSYDPFNPSSESQTSSFSTSLPAHTFLRQIQCARCLRPLRTPLRLPCGNTLCRECLPAVQPRVGITYPAGEGRKYRFKCPWEKEESCVGEHCVADCGVDVLLTRLVEVVEEVLAGDIHGSEYEEDKSLDMSWADPNDLVETWKTVCLEGGALRGVYRMIKEGRFDYDASDVVYDRKDGIEQTSVDAVLLTRLKQVIRDEFDCQVCYSFISDPLTTPCGHTFCRKCVELVLNHSDLCPLCRRKLNMPSTIQSEPINSPVAGLMECLFPDQVSSRRESLAQDEASLDNEQMTPLFVSSIAFPTMPIFLHVFEPRYRIMIRRIMASRERKFGMVAYNRARRRQGGLGRIQFMQYGTLMLVDRFEMLPDGRSLVIATGVSRFKVTKADMLDGYHVGQVERLDDVPITVEESNEAAEAAVFAETLTESQQPSEPQEETQKSLESMSTQQLFDLALDFVRTQHRIGAPWLHPRALMAYGNEPTDPSRFPWWLASILRVSDEEKYRLLCATSVRERLKISARWVKKLESGERYVAISTHTSMDANLTSSNRPLIMSVL